MNCLHCHEPIVLVPSAAERSAKDVTGKSAAYYTALFPYHATCTLAMRQESTLALMRAYKDQPKGDLK